MSTSADKNTDALEHLFKSRELASRLTKTRIAVFTSDESDSTSGLLLAEILGDVLGRLWPNIDVTGPFATLVISSAQRAAHSGGMDGNGIGNRWEPPYDVVVSLDCHPPKELKNVILVSGSGWTADFGLRSDLRDRTDKNPLGPAFAAAVAGAQVFRRVFLTELNDCGHQPMEQHSFDVRDICGSRDSLARCADLDVGDVHLFGVGAVTHSFLWLLQRWPAGVVGRLFLVDPDSYGNTNGQRYTGMAPEDVGHSKVLRMAARLRSVLPTLQVEEYESDLDTYCAKRGIANPLGRIISGLDSEEARRHAALKLPERAVNLWADDLRLGAGRFVRKGGMACLFCQYPEFISLSRDEVAIVSVQTGLRPDVVRELFDTGRALTADEAKCIADKYSIDVNSFAGQPLRSALPALCASGRIRIEAQPEATTIPFAFSTLFAGIAGFMMFLKDLLGDDPSEAWVQHVFALATPHMHTKRAARDGCLCCEHTRISA